MSTQNNNLYEELYMWDYVKAAYLISHVLLSVFCPLLLLSIIWYEKNSADLRYRYLINQLLSYLCFILLFGILVPRPIGVATLFLGPFSHTSCDVIVWSGRFSFTCSLGELTIRQVSISMSMLIALQKARLLTSGIELLWECFHKIK